MALSSLHSLAAFTFRLVFITDRHPHPTVYRRLLVSGAVCLHSKHVTFAPLLVCVLVNLSHNLVSRWWCSGGLAIAMSLVWLPTTELSSNDSGQVDYALVLLSPNSIILYRRLHRRERNGSKWKRYSAYRPYSWVVFALTAGSGPWKRRMVTNLGLSEVWNILQTMGLVYVMLSSPAMTVQCIRMQWHFLFLFLLLRNTDLLTRLVAYCRWCWRSIHGWAEACLRAFACQRHCRHPRHPLLLPRRQRTRTPVQTSLQVLLT